MYDVRHQAAWPRDSGRPASKNEVIYIARTRLTLWQPSSHGLGSSKGKGKGVPPLRRVGGNSCCGTQPDVNVTSVLSASSVLPILGSPFDWVCIGEKHRK